jgi:NAD+ kinase
MNAAVDPKGRANVIERPTRPRVAFLVKRSAWTAMQTVEHARRVRSLIRHGDPTVARLAATHAAHERAVEETQRAFDALGVRATSIGPKSRDLRANRFDLVVTIGGDGTLLRASHKVVDVPVLGINSAPDTSVGFFCGGRAGEVHATLARALEGNLRARRLARMTVTVAGERVSSRVLNDALVCHRSPAATSRYLLELGETVEEQKSSGFWIGPAAGSTAAQRSAGGRVLPLDSEALQLVVREPYQPRGGAYALTRALVPPGERLTVRSKMREGAIYLDGPDVVVRIGFGDVITFARSDEPLTILGLRSRR